MRNGQKLLIIAKKFHGDKTKVVHIPKQPRTAA